jgi:hypothetical protein
MRRLFKNGLRAEGTIVRIETERVWSSSRNHYVNKPLPIIEFEDRDGKNWETRLEVAINGARVGMRVELIYDPKNPMDAIKPDKTQYLVALGFLIASGILIGLGVQL